MREVDLKEGVHCLAEVERMPVVVKPWYEVVLQGGKEGMLVVVGCRIEVNSVQVAEEEDSVEVRWAEVVGQ